MRKILVFLLFCMMIVGSVRAADNQVLYDGQFDRPSYFQDFKQPNQWPNNMTYFVKAVDGQGNALDNYEVAVYDQNNELRAIGRSISSQMNLCSLVICGTEGDEFHFRILYGDFENPEIRDAKETCRFVTNENIYPSQAFVLTPYTPTGIQDVKRPKAVETSGYYDLMGRKCSQNASGILIVNGRKIIRK